MPTAKYIAALVPIAQMIRLVTAGMKKYSVVGGKEIETKSDLAVAISRL